MLTGKELGAAIKSAIDKKIESGAVKTKIEVAAHFKVRPPSLHDWINKGTISKEKLPELWHYFSDVVEPGHWGLSSYPTEASKPRLVDWPFENIDKARFDLLTDRQKGMIEDRILLALAEIEATSNKAKTA